MRYPVTPTLSVEAVQETLICEDDRAVAVRPAGTDGAMVSVVTVTVTVAVTVPELLLAVSVYVVVATGVTGLEDRPVTLPTPLMDRSGLGDPVTVQDKVEDCPGETDGGDAVKDEITGGCPKVVAEAEADCAETFPA